MIAVPLSGWLMSSAKGFQTVWFGVLPIPDLLSKDRALGNQLLVVHQLLNYALIAVIGLHVGGAAKHALIDRDDVFKRMLPHRWL
jgi:cytochrome b561